MDNTQKPKLVVMLSRFPYPLEKGDKLRAYYQIIEMSKVYSITLLCVSERNVNESDKKELEKHCVSVQIFQLPKWKSWVNSAVMLFGSKPLQIAYFYSSTIQSKIKTILYSTKPDYIFCQLIRASEYVKNYHDCPKTLDYMDAFSMGVERRIDLLPFYKKWLFRLESKRLSNYEREIFDYFEWHTIISEQDANLLGTTPNQKVHCVPNGVSSSFLNYTTKLSPQYDLVFVGNLNYPPNVEAVKFIVREILSLASKKGKAWTFVAAGAEPSREIISLFENTPNSTLLPNVDDIREAYTAGRVFIAPMKIGTGLQNKLLEAMALSMPCVTTSLANNALNALDNVEVLLAESVEDFVETISELLESNKGEAIGQAAKKMIRDNFSWEQCTKGLLEGMKKTQNL